MSEDEVVKKPESEKRLCEIYNINELFPITAALLQCGLLDGPMTSSKLDEIAQTHFGLNGSKEFLEKFYLVDPKGAKIVENSLMKGDGYPTAKGLCDYVIKILEGSDIKKGSSEYIAIMEKFTEEFHRATRGGW